MNDEDKQNRSGHHKGAKAAKQSTFFFITHHVIRVIKSEWKRNSILSVDKIEVLTDEKYEMN